MFDRRTRIRSLAALAAMALPGGGGDDRDLVRTTDGRTLRGRIVLELEDRIAIRTGTRERWIPTRRIQAIRSIARAHRELMAMLADADPRDPQQLAALAEFCQEARLDHEAKLLWWRVLLQDPQHDDANHALGHVRDRRGWRIRDGRRRRTLAELERRRASWPNAWRLRSEHFRVRCDRGLAVTLDVLFELEALYDGFLAIFQRDLELREVLEPIDVFVYRDRDRFPNISNNIGAYFSFDERVLYTWMAGERPYALFHEATHAILFAMAGGARRGRGALPGWLHEGWAEYMDSLVHRVRPGLVRVVRGRVDERRLEVVRRAERRYTVHRVLNFKSSDFGASTKQILKYAQSYALFRYMWDGAGGKYRERFRRYLRKALDGQGQASTFRRAFSARELAAIERNHAGPD